MIVIFIILLTSIIAFLIGIQTKGIINNILIKEQDDSEDTDIDNSLKKELEECYSNSTIIEMALEISENLGIKPNNYEYEEEFIDALVSVLVIKIFNSYTDSHNLNKSDLICMVDEFKEFCKEIIKNSNIIKDLQYENKELKDEVIIENDIQKPNEIEQALNDFYND